MNKITKEQLGNAENLICQQVKDLYDQQAVLSQLYYQIKLNKKLGSFWANTGEPPITFCIRGQLNIPLSIEVCKVLGLL